MDVDIKQEEISPPCQGSAKPFHQKRSVETVASSHAPPCTCGMNTYVRNHPSILDIKFPGSGHEFKVRDLLKLHPNLKVKDLFEAFMGGNDYRYRNFVKQFGKSGGVSKWCQFMYASFFYYLRDWESLEVIIGHMLHQSPFLLVYENIRKNCIKKFNEYLEELTASRNQHNIVTHKMIATMKEEGKSSSEVAASSCTSPSPSAMNIFVKNHPSLLDTHFPRLIRQWCPYEDDDFKVRDLVELYPNLLVEDLLRAYMGGWRDSFKPVSFYKWVWLSLWNMEILFYFFRFVEEWPLLKGRDGTLLYEQVNLYFKNESFRKECIAEHDQFIAALTQKRIKEEPGSGEPKLENSPSGYDSVARDLQVKVKSEF